MMVELDFGEVITRVDIELKKRHQSRTALASCGVPVSSLSHWSKGRVPSVLSIARIAEYLEVSIEYLLTGKETSELGQDEKELLRLFGGLDGRDRTTLLDLARSLASRYGSSSAVDFRPVG